jgi:hypothetical protein
LACATTCRNRLNGLRGRRRPEYDSSMCSTAAARIAEIGQAIENLANEVLASTVLASKAPASDGDRPGTAAVPDQTCDADQIAIRLAELWSRLAELDPEVARRLPTYEA